MKWCYWGNASPSHGHNKGRQVAWKVSKSLQMCGWSSFFSTATCGSGKMGAGGSSSTEGQAETTRVRLDRALVSQSHDFALTGDGRWAMLLPSTASGGPNPRQGGVQRGPSAPHAHAQLAKRRNRTLSHTDRAARCASKARFAGTQSSAADEPTMLRSRLLPHVLLPHVVPFLFIRSTCAYGPIAWLRRVVPGNNIGPDQTHPQYPQFE